MDTEIRDLLQDKVMESGIVDMIEEYSSTCDCDYIQECECINYKKMVNEDFNDIITDISIDEYIEALITTNCFGPCGGCFSIKKTINILTQNIQSKYKIIHKNNEIVENNNVLLKDCGIVENRKYINVYIELFDCYMKLNWNINDKNRFYLIFDSNYEVNGIEIKNNVETVILEKYKNISLSIEKDRLKELLIKYDRYKELSEKLYYAKRKKDIVGYGLMIVSPITIGVLIAASPLILIGYGIHKGVKKYKNFKPQLDEF